MLPRKRWSNCLMNEAFHRAGFVAVIGRPNTGKSTLVNALVKEKISIVTAKPQTTRHSILGILNLPESQVVFVDTPGLHAGSGKLINRAMNRAAVNSLAGADLALLVVDAVRWTPEDQRALDRVVEAKIPVFLVINKIDLVKPRSALLPVIEEFSAQGSFEEVIPISARRAENLDRLIALIEKSLPQSSPLFPADTTTDRGMEFRIGEILREKLLETLREEVPYGLTVEVIALEERDDLMLADAIIWVEKESHKGIVVGNKGQRLKQIATSARLDMESVFGRRFYLESKVKVKENWSDNARALAQLGYESPK